MSDFKITEKWLMEAGGWAEMKRARQLVASGRILDVHYDGKGRLTGKVTDGRGKPMLSGMLIRGRTDVETLCKCPDARRTGMLCQHALALGLATLEPLQETLAKPAPATQARQAPSKTSAVSFSHPQHPLHFTFTDAFTTQLDKGSLAVQVREIPGTNKATADDLPFLAWLQQHGENRVPPHLRLELGQFVTFLNTLQGHPRVTLGKEPLRIADSPIRLPMTLTALGQERVRLAVKPLANVRLIVGEKQVWAYLADQTCLLPCPKWTGEDPHDWDAVADILRSPQKLKLERSWRWFFRNVEALETCFHLEAPDLPQRPRLHPQPPRIQLELEGSLNHLAARLTCRYGDIEVAPDAESTRFPYPAPDRPWEWLDRDPASERKAMERLEGIGFSKPDRSGQQTLRSENAILRFFATDLPKLQREWDVTVRERFAHVTRDIERVQPVLSVMHRSESGWLDVDIGYGAGAGTSLPKHEIQRLLQVGQSHTRLKNGRRVAVDLSACEEWNEVLRDVEPEQRHGHFRIAAAQEDYLTATLQLERRWDAADIPKRPFPVDLLQDLNTILRDYQKDGVAWMLARTDRGLSGILADEMGLGKTLQSLAVAQALHAAAEKPSGERPRSLVVCPTSLLENWRSEAERFTPGLRTLVIHGADRTQLWKNAASCDLLITSYGLLTRDLDHFSAIPFLAVFIDEASAIKNASTQNAKAAYRLQAQYRFALTGTPIENSVRDLWSIMHFVAPGYLGSHSTFRERYEKPLAAAGGVDSAIHQRLRRRLQPFVLRRTKRRVAAELPDKIEKVLTCELSARQRALYTDLLRAGREKLLDARKQGEGVARMSMLTTLLRLRQVCCDTRLLTDATEKGGHSAKLALLDEILEESREGEHRVLIFSQFVGMLHLLRRHLEERAIDYCYLDGQTKDRASQVARFQAGEVPVFLISLKAGGYGLTLTAADTVIHYDPWWNPAVEAQATDRAHRIGQTNVVTSYKLIAKDTVEEKILRLQRRKREIIDAALEDDQPMMTGLTADDLAEVLEM